MPRTMMGTQELFEDPAFGTQLTEWQRSNIDLSGKQSAFCDGVDNDFGGADRVRQQPEDTGEYICELTIEEFDDPANIWRDMVSDRTMELHDLRAKANIDLNEAKDELLLISEEEGASQFVLWGLGRYLQSHASDISVGALRGKIQTAEDRFVVVDNLVRENPGEVLTVVNHPMGLTAGEIGDGGIALQNGHVRVPLQEGAASYYASIISDRPEIYESPKFSISADQIAIAEPVIMLPNEALNIRAWWRNRISLLVGGVVSGPLVDIENDEGVANAAYLEDITQRLRIVTAVVSDAPLRKEMVVPFES